MIHHHPTPGINTFLQTSFSNFSKKRYSYCVLRNYQHLPFHTGGSDIDMLIDAAAWHKTHSLLHKAASETGGKCISKLKARRVLDLAFCGKTKNKWWGVRFDTFTYVGTNGCDIFPADEFLTRSFTHNGVRVADKGDAAVLSFMKEVIGAGQDPKNYQVRAKTAWRKTPDYYAKIMSRYFDEITMNGTISPLINGDFTDLSFAKYSLRNNWKKKFFLRHPFLAFLHAIQEKYYQVGRLLKTPGFSVAVLGTDGSGKSSIIDKITPPLEAALHNKIRYEHMRPNLLPSISRLFGKQTIPGPVKDPHASEPSGVVGSLLRLTYYSFDYVVGYWLKVHISKARRTCLWIFDRYFYDYLIDPKRGRIHLPLWVIRLYGIIIPKPGLVLCLGADPEVIHGRKPELPLDEVKRQVMELKKFCSRTRNAIWIDTGCPLEDSVDQALIAITSAMAARYEK